GAPGARIRPAAERRHRPRARSARRAQPADRRGALAARRVGRRHDDAAPARRRVRRVGRTDSPDRGQGAAEDERRARRVRLTEAPRSRRGVPFVLSSPSLPPKGHPRRHSFFAPFPRRAPPARQRLPLSSTPMSPTGPPRTEAPLAALSCLLFNALVWGVSWWPFRQLNAMGLRSEERV